MRVLDRSGARGSLENFSASTYSLRRPRLVLVSGSSLPRACARVKESPACPIPGIADAGKNAMMNVAIGSGWVDAGSETLYNGSELLRVCMGEILEGSGNIEVIQA